MRTNNNNKPLYLHLFAFKNVFVLLLIHNIIRNIKNYICIYRQLSGRKGCKAQRQIHFLLVNINWRDGQRKIVVNNVDMSSLKAQWQIGPYKKPNFAD